jgi:hypothetical protein
MSFLFVLACRAPVDAPAEIDELSSYLYANFNGNGTDEERALPAGLITLENYLNTLELELSIDVDDRAVSLSPLTEAELDGTSAAEGINLDMQVGVAVSTKTPLTMEQELSLIMDSNQVCIAADSTAYHQVTVLSGEDCFADGSCERMETSNEFFIDSISDGWLDTWKDYRWVELDDGRKAIVAREWMPNIAPATSGSNSWDQRFSIVVWLPSTDGASTLRYYALWSSVTTILTDELYANMVKDGLDDHYNNTVAFINGDDCDKDRTREYDRE